MKIKIPSGWPEVTVEKFIQLKGVEEKDFATNLSFRMEQIYILTDTDSETEVWDQMPAEDLSDIIKRLDFLSTSPSHNFKRELNDFHYKESLTLGEFIDLEYLCGISYFEKLPTILAILYRKNHKNEWGHTVIEPRGYNEDQRAEMFLDVPINDVYGVLQSYLNLKKKILDAYGEMLRESDGDDLEAETAETGEPKTAEDLEAEKQERLANKWAWERVIYHYSQKSNLTFREVTDLPLIFFMNQLSMFHELKF